MATILLSAAGAALGAGFGGTVLGLSGAVIGRAIGSTLGRFIDQRILGGGSEVVEVGRVERFRLMGASEGTGVPRIWGRVRVSGHVIWATRFQEQYSTSGGKGAPRPETETYSYSISMAVALCEGEISSVGRIWLDGNEVAPDKLNIRVYKGTEDQLPDPKIEAVEGTGNAPAYRGIAYVVVENLNVTAYGNRVPQFSFEVIRPAQGALAAPHPDLSKTIEAVCLIPGTGEYALATTPVYYDLGTGVSRSANVNSASAKTDFATSLEHLREELPNCLGVSVVVSWFGDDLRCGECEIRPKVEQITNDGTSMPWWVNGLTRAQASTVPTLDEKSVYGGTPADQSVVEAIQAIRAGGQEVTLYPFILMEQLAGNTLPDPWSGAIGQAALPWRGRITLNTAPGNPGTTDSTTAAADEVAAFFGDAQPEHFIVANNSVSYTGPAEWSFRRFILHYAKLCALAGGVDTFCIGSEMRSLTQIRGGGGSFPAVAALRQLAADVRLILGGSTKITYAADWSEYFGYQTGNNVYFHLDPLWADANIDFVGIDNYMPISDWRDGEFHADAGWGDIYNIDYLRANVAGGEGFDWYYDGPEGEAAQLRKPITDEAYGEPWVYRFKDLKSWWQNQHHQRIGGVRQVAATAWVPGSKPIRFTEYGCAALDKGTNQPNRFLDAKSSESGLPKYSDGSRDDLMQLAYFQAMAEHWADPLNNPMSAAYGDRMLDAGRSHAWAWDSRPFPVFPGNTELWSDGENYDKGHWLNGRSSGQNLAAVIAEICEVAGVEQLDVTRAIGLVRGFSVGEVGTARAALQPLMLAYGTDAVEREGMISFATRTGKDAIDLVPEYFAVTSEIEGTFETRRAADIDTPRRVRLAFTEAESDFTVRAAEAIFPDAFNDVVSQSELPLVMTRSEAVSIAERWMAEARVSRDTARFALPRSRLDVGAGNVVSVGGDRYRVDRIEQSEMQLIEAVKIDQNAYLPIEVDIPPRAWVPYLAPLPVYPVFLDLPLLSGAEIPHEPHVCAAALPWPGPVGVWSSATEDGYVLNKSLTEPAVIGVSETALLAHPAGQWSRGPVLRVRVDAGFLSSAGEADVYAGANVAAIGSGDSGLWEVIQFSQAALVAPNTYELSLLLRGQAGTDGIMPDVWPVGSIVVLFNKALQQIDLAESTRGLSRSYRVGPEAEGSSGANVIVRSEAFDGIGLRPYSVCHLAASMPSGADVALDWIRRTRIDGDSWQSLEVPLGEDSEQYMVRVFQASTVLRETVVTTPHWTYSQAMQTQDGASGSIDLAVAQISQRFGPGPFRSVSVGL